MTAADKAAAPAPRPARSPGTAVRGRDREFLPAALEILETPPAPKSVAFMLTICSFAALALVWSFFGRLDIHAVAWGKVEANGRSKVIQPLEPGKILSIQVENGQTVAAGDKLILLDPAEAIADEKAMGDALLSARAEMLRRKLAVTTAQQLQQPSTTAALLAKAGTIHVAPRIQFPDDVPPAIRDREQAVLAADLSQLNEALKNIDMQMAQRDAMRRRLEMSISVQNDLIRTLEERVDVRSATYKLKIGTSLNLFDAQESLQKSKVQLASDKGQLDETDAALEELKSQKTKLASQFVAENQTRLADADRKAEELTQQLSKARARLSRTILTSPIDGVVQQLAATTIGQVVTTGQQLLVVSPSNGALQVEAFVSNVDIGFVRVGQVAEIKVDAFPFTRFGTIRGKVVRVAKEAIDEQEAKRQQSNPLAPANPTGSAPLVAPGQSQSFVFPVTLALESLAVQVGDTSVPLAPGMTMTAEIKTDSRRVIDYLLSPIMKITSEAMKER